MNGILFDKEESTKMVTLSELQETSSLLEYNGKLPKNRPEDHFKAFLRILTLADSSNIAAEVKEIYVARADAKRILPNTLDPMGIGALPSWMFQRLVGRITLGNVVHQDLTPTIAIGYNTRGLTIGWGLNVGICENMCIFSNNIMSTYGNSRIEYDKAFNVIADWMHQFDEKVDYDIKTVETMQSTFIPDIYEFIGRLQVGAVRSAYVDTKEKSPLGISQVSEFSRNILKENVTLEDDISAWKAYNIATDILKPNNTDMVNIWQDNNDMANYIMKEYCHA